jgi:hypothetical protein
MIPTLEEIFRPRITVTQQYINSLTTLNQSFRTKRAVVCSH